IFFGTCGIFLQSLTEWVYRQTPMLLTFHVLLGTLASLYYIRKHAGIAPEDQFRARDEAMDSVVIPEPAPAEGVV
ncbi:MAG TPA: hypothetical protein VKM56_12605, partial [Verrucomicrobiae bacterium]|nr:hypothetical protein [Verrucomicrobiae bacterium]